MPDLARQHLLRSRRGAGWFWSRPLLWSWPGLAVGASATAASAPAAACLSLPRSALPLSLIRQGRAFLIILARLRLSVLAALVALAYLRPGGERLGVPPSTPASTMATPGLSFSLFAWAVRRLLRCRGRVGRFRASVSLVGVGPDSYRRVQIRWGGIVTWTRQRVGASLGSRDGLG